MNRISPYERRHEPLLSRRGFMARLMRHALVAGGLIAASLGVGTIGYRTLGGLEWVDAFENASMILTGMGPVSPMLSVAAKLFASGYALFSGIVFVTCVGVVLAPTVHRLLHHFHFEEDDERNG